MSSAEYKREYAKKWRAEHPERAKEYRERYMKAHPMKNAEYVKRWADHHPVQRENVQLRCAYKRLRALMRADPERAKEIMEKVDKEQGYAPIKEENA